MGGVILIKCVSIIVIRVLWQAIQQHWIDLDTLIPDVQVASTIVYLN